MNSDSDSSMFRKIESSIILSFHGSVGKMIVIFVACM